MNEAHLPYEQKICFMAEYFLPDVDKLEEKPCIYECHILVQKDFADLYVPAWVEMTAKPVLFVEDINRRDS